jgi:hypothetical protein
MDVKSRLSCEYYENNLFEMMYMDDEDDFDECKSFSFQIPRDCKETDPGHSLESRRSIQWE